MYWLNYFLRNIDRSLKDNHTMARRFQRVSIEEPNIEDSIKIIKGLKECYETFHNVTYSNEAIKNSVELSSRYIKDRKLPDIAIDIIDEVGASFHLQKRKSKKTYSCE